VELLFGLHQPQVRRVMEGILPWISDCSGDGGPLCCLEGFVCWIKHLEVAPTVDCDVKKNTFIEERDASYLFYL
jgi:hypothetical protein